MINMFVVPLMLLSGRAPASPLPWPATANVGPVA
jgi:hypothetical protein